MTENIEQTLHNRGSLYGTIEDNAAITQLLMTVLESHGKNYNKLSVVHKECLHMIFHKIARMVSGNVDYIDNVHDIVGYAKLLEDYLTEQEGLRDLSQPNNFNPTVAQL